LGARMPRTKERTVRLENATVVTFEGPGSEWICVIRGTGAEVEQVQKRERKPPRRRQPTDARR
jgi:hypothetical protein